jgi:hypothetical protein
VSVLLPCPFKRSDQTKKILKIWLQTMIKFLLKNNLNCNKRLDVVHLISSSWFLFLRINHYYSKKILVGPLIFRFYFPVYRWVAPLIRYVTTKGQNNIFCHTTTLSNSTLIWPAKNNWLNRKGCAPNQSPVRYEIWRPEYYHMLII